MQPRVTVLGSGSWGTTFAAVCAHAGSEVTLWGRDNAIVDQINISRRNERYLQGFELPQITATTELEAAVAGADILVVAIPSQSAREFLTPLRNLLRPDAVAVSLMKGIELRSGQRMSEVLAEALDIPAERVGVVSGPNLALEIAAKQPTATVVASAAQETAERIAAACASSYFRPYTNTDVVGVELCGAVKNVIALAVGIAQGIGFGDNTTATLITRGLAEITRLGLELGANEVTFAGLAGVGDLVATCTSTESRNHTVGYRIGQGIAVIEAVQIEAGTAEGVKSCGSVLALAESMRVDMPITAVVDGIINRGQSVSESIPLLLSRPRKAEGN